ncbi:hypothetical protein GUJ93_ZPchr0012g20302 [Zizania palustris]|uniref:DUF7597 domain-containing protein n=1 Tax=Zizania palustris TaxID=103762 RepID=A0A8J5WTK8_ZIZPA|nr:hypothetical protein GUJ93_ZPchr0012g20302 [Zizania palustris]
MANFAMDPIMYVPRGGTLIDGGGALRKRRSVVTLSGQHVRKNEDMAIATCANAFTAMERHEFLLLIHHHLTQAPAAEQEPLVEPFIVDPMENEGQWDNWPANLPNIIPGQQAPDEMNQSTTVPSALSTPMQGKPPIKFFYSRRSKGSDKGGQSSEKASHLKEIGSPSKTDKGKGIMPEKPTLQDFINAANEGKPTVELSFGQIRHVATQLCGLNDDQVTLDKLMTDGTSNQLVRGGGITIREVDE